MDEVKWNSFCRKGISEYSYFSISSHNARTEEEDTNDVFCTQIPSISSSVDQESIWNSSFNIESCNKMEMVALSLRTRRSSQSEIIGLSREERRKLRRSTLKYRTAHASRERIRVEAFNHAFGRLRCLLPTLPPDKKLSKIEILRLAICYIRYLNHVLES
ncbi:hypothetical protein QYM36_007623 [Artemia franciscana]|uniref:BHLH domain-containing protein n=1 Tax=Artemia franciscana TaxID=6661 RepID=A0AA88LH78_ARTSF|nr:hypothetical protein QYM36_007623 [Artemia franciscana]